MAFYFNEPELKEHANKELRTNLVLLRLNFCYRIDSGCPQFKSSLLPLSHPNPIPSPLNHLCHSGTVKDCGLVMKTADAVFPNHSRQNLGEILCKNKQSKLT